MTHLRTLSSLTVLALMLGAGLAVIGLTTTYADSASRLQLSISPLDCTVNTVEAAQQQGATVIDAFGSDCQAFLDSLKQTIADTGSKGQVVTYAIEEQATEEPSVPEEQLPKPEGSVKEPSERHLIYTVVDTGQQAAETALTPHEQKSNEVVVVAVAAGSVVLVSIILLLCFIILL